MLAGNGTGINGAVAFGGTGGGGGTGNTITVSFATTSGQNDYTAADVPELADAAALGLQMISLNDGLINTLASWDGTTLSIDAGVIISDGDFVVATFS